MKVIFVLLVLVLPGYAFCLDTLYKGSKSYSSRELTDSEFIGFTKIAKDIMQQGIKGIDLSHYIDRDGSIFALMDDISIVSFSKDSNSIQGHWALSRWSEELMAQQVQTMYNPNYDWVSGDGWDLYTDETYQLNYRDSKPSLGCYGQHPLRYGDLEEDGSNELILFLGSFEYKQDLLVFSPDHERIVFSMRYALQDALEFDSSEWQYIQRTRQRDGNAGTRVYAKAFFGDFDSDDNPDILVWRKRFESLKPSDPQNGFERTEQIWQHFERDLEAQESSDQGVTGQYLPQGTDSATIQGWLAEDELTWSLGYPSKSECDGHEGELIPEMHDPLLNDPDVLQ